MPWIDGFITWSKTEVTDNVKCCRYHRDSQTEFCPSNYGNKNPPDQAVVNDSGTKVDDSMFANYDQFYYDVSDKSRRRRQSGDYGDYGDTPAQIQNTDIGVNKVSRHIFN